MGIKENFTQAVKDLTGGRDKEASKGGVPVEELKKAVEADDAQAAREITLNGRDEFSVRPLNQGASSASTSASENVPDATPASEAFFSGGEVPQSSFGQIFGRSPNEPNVSGNSVNMNASPNQQNFQNAQASQNQQSFQNAPSQPNSQNFQNQSNQQGFQIPQNAPNRDGVEFFNVNRQSSPAPMQSRRGGRDEENEITVISRNTTIDGNIRSFADMSIDGDIKGDVETTKNIDLNGKVIGNITCNNALMHASQIQGNIRMKGNVSMRRDTLLIGDLMSTYADINGKVKGNLDVVGKADLKGDAVVFGDISASTITVEDGAIIQGYVSTTFLNKEESRNLFPETVTIGDGAQ